MNVISIILWRNISKQVFCRRAIVSRFSVILQISQPICSPPRGILMKPRNASCSWMHACARNLIMILLNYYSLLLMATIENVLLSLGSLIGRLKLIPLFSHRRQTFRVMEKISRLADVVAVGTVTYLM